MNFQPVIPFGGYTGWRFLQRTVEIQQTVFVDSQPIQRATDYFRENISGIQTAEDLVKDRQLLQVALGAFGLDEDINNKYFIQKILEGGTNANDSLANRLADNRYAAFSNAFGFGDSNIPLTSQTIFAKKILDRYEARQFERAVGEQNNDIRLALNLESALSDVTIGSVSENAQWFGMMGNQPLRRVFEMALGLPSQLGRIDLDQQLETFRARAQSTFGTDKLSVLAQPENREKLIRLFLVRAEAAASSSFGSSNIALSLLQTGQLNRSDLFG